MLKILWVQMAIFGDFHKFLNFSILRGFFAENFVRKRFEKLYSLALFDIFGQNLQFSDQICKWDKNWRFGELWWRYSQN